MIIVFDDVRNVLSEMSRLKLKFHLFLNYYQAIITTLFQVIH